MRLGTPLFPNLQSWEDFDIHDSGVKLLNLCHAEASGHCMLRMLSGLHLSDTRFLGLSLQICKRICSHDLQEKIRCQKQRASQSTSSKVVPRLKARNTRHCEMYLQQPRIFSSKTSILIKPLTSFNSTCPLLPTRNQLSHTLVSHNF
jgi:hypothetical protein